MTPVIEGVSRRFAEVGTRFYDRVTSHFFVQGSAAPICQPREQGVAELHHSSTATALCELCESATTVAIWAVADFAKQHLWGVWLVGRGGKPFATGLVSSNVEAFDAVCASLSRALPASEPVRLRRVSPSMLETVARERRAEARAAKPGKAAGPQLRESLYCHERYYPSLRSFTFEWRTTSFRIVKRTAKKVFVEDTRSTYKTESGATVLKTFALDRAELERTGKCRGFTTDPQPPHMPGATSAPGWAEVLGVPPSCTLAEAKRAFRVKARETHPDQGGDATSFQRVREAYAAAERVLGAA